jgi:hypothetical protein
LKKSKYANLPSAIAAAVGGGYGPKNKDLSIA